LRLHYKFFRRWSSNEKTYKGKVEDCGMPLLILPNNEIFSLVIIPLLIFLFRIIDVSIGTIRIIFVSKGFKVLAPVLGFFEVFVWLITINQLMGNFNNPIYYISYAGGFAAGTYVGMLIEDKLQMGKVTIRVVTGRDSPKLFKELTDTKYTITTFGARGRDGNVRLILIVTDRSNIKEVISIVKRHNPNAFYSIEDVRMISQSSEGIMRDKKNYFFTKRK
jgi:uncharacterized protein YebE (UPF0316 family)